MTNIKSLGNKQRGYFIDPNIVSIQAKICEVRQTLAGDKNHGDPSINTFHGSTDALNRPFLGRLII
jgi:hypothetical protein